MDANKGIAMDSIFSDPSFEAQSSSRGSPAQGINKTDAAALAGRFGFACRALCPCE